jgi:invasion protein IalB
MKQTSNTPVVTSIVPNNGTQGQTLTGVLINGSNLTGATAVTFIGTGVTASNLTVNAAGTQITATVTIGTTSTLGVRDISVTTPVGTSTSLIGGFTVNSTSSTTLTFTSSAVSDGYVSHNHEVNTVKIDIDTPPASGKTINTSTYVDHYHTITLSQQDYQSLKSGNTVTVTTSTINAHTHTFTLHI